MAANISVRLEVRDSGIRELLIGIVGSMPSYELQQDGTPGAPNLMILELNAEDPDQTFAHVESIAKSMPDTAIALTGEAVDPNALLKAMRAGVKEFLLHPIDPGDAKAVLERLGSQLGDVSQARPARKGTVMSLIGGKAGVGTTSVTVNLATAVMELHPDRTVAVLDLNLRDGDLSTFFDLAPTRSLQDIDSDLGRLDDTFLTGIMTKHTTGLLVLPLGEMELSGGYVTSECVEQTLEVMRSMYDYVFVDCGHVVDLATQAALDSSKHILIVSTVSVPVVQRTKRMLDVLRDGNEGDSRAEVSLLINRLSVKEEEVLADVAEMLKVVPISTLAADYELAGQAINEGVPLVVLAPKKELSKGFHTLAAKLTDPGGATKKGSLLTGLARSVGWGRSNPKPSLAN